MKVEKKSFFFILLTTIVLVIVVFTQFINQTQRTVLSFCYWKTTFELKGNDSSLFNTLKPEHLYIRYFDVGWNHQTQKAFPIEPINIHDNILPMVKEITPVVYIKNDLFCEIDPKEIPGLISNLIKKIYSINDNLSDRYYYTVYDSLEKKKISRDSLQNIATSMSESLKKKVISEVLIDCDWTGKSKDAYFNFLRALKDSLKKVSIKTSCTLRLYQFKNEKLAGVPPVDNCLLMCYNIGDVKSYNESNSIFNTKEVEKYMRKDYPLKLDIALPIFYWGVVFRGKSFKGILNPVNLSDFKDSSCFKLVEKNRYFLKKDTVFGNTYFRYGDEIKLETVNHEELMGIAKTLQNNINFSGLTKISFFALDSNYIQNYGTENIQKIFHSFHHN